MWTLKFSDHSDINFFTGLAVAPFKSTLDAVMKELQASEQYTACEAKIITKNVEDDMWSQVFLKITLHKHCWILWQLYIPGCTLLFVEERVIINFAIVHHNWHLWNHQHKCHTLGVQKMFQSIIRVVSSITSKRKEKLCTMPIQPTQSAVWVDCMNYIIHIVRTIVQHLHFI